MKKSREKGTVCNRYSFPSFTRLVTAALKTNKPSSFPGEPAHFVGMKQKGRDVSRSGARLKDRSGIRDMGIS